MCGHAQLRAIKRGLIGRRKRSSEKNRTCIYSRFASRYVFRATFFAIFLNFLSIITATFNGIVFPDFFRVNRKKVSKISSYRRATRFSRASFRICVGKKKTIVIKIKVKGFEDIPVCAKKKPHKFDDVAAQSRMTIPTTLRNDIYKGRI